MNDLTGGGGSGGNGEEEEAEPSVKRQRSFPRVPSVAVAKGSTDASNVLGKEVTLLFFKIIPHLHSDMISLPRPKARTL